jgi:hypothetical protein
MKKSAGRNLRIPTFAEVAQLLAPSDAPPWLPALLEWWAQGIRHDRWVDEFRPSKVKTVDRLSGMIEALALLRKELEDPSIRNLLETSITPNRIRIPIATLRDLSHRAEVARSSPVLTGKGGETKRGPGKPAVPGIFDAKSLCAARIFEAWRFFNKREPGIRNLKAAEAAQAYWLASGGISKGYGNPLNGWYHYFRTVREHERSPGLKRLIWRRDLEQCVQRGRQPWYLGTYFPIPDSRN